MCRLTVHNGSDIKSESLFFVNIDTGLAFSVFYISLCSPVNKHETFYDCV